MSGRSLRFLARLAGLGLLAVLPALAAAEAPAVVALVDRIEEAYQARDLAALEDARQDLLRGAIGGRAVTPRAGYYAAYARFRQALGAADDKAAARSFLDDCIAELTDWVAANPRDAEARALLGSCYGISTTYYPLALVARGLEARKHLNAALALAPGNPWVVLQDGLADFSTPRLFGGSRSAAIAKLERAARLFGDAADAGSRAAAWAEVEAWQQLALMYAATGRPDAAAEAAARANDLPRTTARIRQASLN